MGTTIFDPQARQAILGRVGRLTPESRPRWGRLTAVRVVPHLADQIRMALGEVDVGSARGPLRFRLPRHLVIHVLPWPKGRAEAPAEAFTTSPQAFECDVATLRELIERIGERQDQRDWPINPVFGKLSGHDWGVLTHRHLDHHLTQFGC